MNVLPDLLVFVGVYFVLWKTVIHKMDGIDKAHYTLLYISICVIIYFTLVPFLVSLPSIFSTHNFTYNFEPFIDWKYQYGFYMQETIYNIILYIPLGFFFTIATKKKPIYGILIGVALSLCVELIQPLLGEGRVGDISDIITNTLGTIIGVYIGRYFIKNSNETNTN